MSELAGAALAWLSYTALHAGTTEPRRRTAMRITSAALVVAAARVASPDDLAEGALIATLAWTVAASVVPIASRIAPRSRVLSSVVAVVVALGAIIAERFDA
ncbi:hypothetical protein [Sandaracinus amylolyticus]|uniref:Uncharacterized protein n=1 Tax=Sandaracinus amylolyticus TaxID=927083 RepID=A0A0F6YLH7_9BACT|nr:hypothetical protein [Sandaracinus amylolyticus]AKF09897.1 hypothetical protein DB32_007046 [Sandaracinus amylolyticus]